MKKIFILSLIATFFAAPIIKAQKTVIFAPTFRYNNNKCGYKEHTTIWEGAQPKTNLWKRGTKGLPTEEEIGYTRSNPNVAQLVVNATPKRKGIDTEKNKYFKINTNLVIDAFNLKPYNKSQNITAEFFVKNQYGHGKVSYMKVLVSTDYAGNNFGSAQWDDVTSKVKNLPIDKSANKWTKCVLNLDDYVGNENVTIIFNYVCPETGNIIRDEDNPENSRSSETWKISDFRVLADTKILDNIKTWNFNASDYKVINKISTDEQQWKGNSSIPEALVVPEGETYNSMKVSAVFKDGDTQSVSPVESWCVLEAVDCSSHENIFLSFYNMSQYKLGGDSDLKIKMSKDYVENAEDSVTGLEEATWTDITDNFVLDKALKYDGNWTLSNGEVEVSSASSVVFAFVYSCTDDVADVKGANKNKRAATWKIANVKVSALPNETGINNINLNKEQNIYPNPAKDVFTVKGNVAVVDIYNVNGSLVKTVKEENKINISDLTSGVYLVKVKYNDNKKFITKLIIK